MDSTHMYACERHFFEHAEYLRREHPTHLGRYPWYYNAENPNFWLCEYPGDFSNQTCGASAVFAWYNDPNTSTLIVDFAAMTSYIYAVEEGSPGCEEIIAWCEANNYLYDLKDGDLKFLYKDGELAEAVNELGLEIESDDFQYYYRRIVFIPTNEEDVELESTINVECDYTFSNKIANWFQGKLPDGFNVVWRKEGKSERKKEGKYLYINAYQGSKISTQQHSLEFTDVSKKYTLEGHTVQASTQITTLRDSIGNGYADLSSEEDWANIWIPFKLSWYNKAHLEFLEFVIERINLFYTDREEFDAIKEREALAERKKQADVLAALANSNKDTLVQRAEDEYRSAKSEVEYAEQNYMSMLSRFDGARAALEAAKNYNPETFDAMKEVERLHRNTKIENIRVEDNNLIVTFNPITCVAVSRQSRIEEIYSIGRIELTIRTNRTIDTDLNRILRFRNLDYPDKAYAGPHIEMRGRNESSVCLGTAQAPLMQLVSQFKFADAVDYILSFLETANLDDTWGRHIREFPRVDN